jgi:hypothetical protein
MVDEYVSIYGRELTEEFNALTPLSMNKDSLETRKRIGKIK